MGERRNSGRVYLAGALAIWLTILSAGCWDRWEIEDRGFVLGVAVDLAEPITSTGFEGRLDETARVEGPAYRLTLQLELPGQAGGMGETGGGQGEASWNISTVQSSLFAGSGVLATRTAHQPYFEHLRVIIIGEEVARQGIREVMDFFLRDPGVRYRVRLYVAEGEAREVLGLKAKQEPFSAVYLASLAENERQANRFAFRADLGDVGRAITEGVDMALPRVVVGQDEAKLAGAAVFKGDRMVGWLGELETTGLRWVRNEMTGGFLVVNLPEGGGLIAFDITESRTRTQVRLEGGRPVFRVDIRVEGNLGEMQKPVDSLDPAVLDKVQQHIAEAIQDQARTAVAKGQEFRTDLFGFGRLLEMRYPAYWREVKDQWEDIFPAVEVQVHVHAYIRRVGLVR